jgi:hypothetical protein
VFLAYGILELALATPAQLDYLARGLPVRFWAILGSILGGAFVAISGWLTYWRRVSLRR